MVKEKLLDPKGQDFSQTYAIETFGCQMNVHDSERMAGLLEQAGHVRVEDTVQADVIILNTCSVRERAEDKLFSRLGEISAKRKQKPPLMVVTGCVAQQEGAEEKQLFHGVHPWLPDQYRLTFAALTRESSQPWYTR